MADVPRLFTWLLMASLAEVLVFLGVVFPLGRLALPRRWAANRAAAGGAGVVLSGVCFGLFHFSYGAPWNTWGAALPLMVVWLVVALVYVGTRSLAAAVAFNNVMAVIGFVRGGVTLPGSLALGLALDALAMGAVASIVLAFSRSGRRVIPNDQLGG